jgi:serine/threonine protein kinase
VLVPGRIVGNYKVEAHVGSGGMAEVYRARHVALGSVHALKVLRPELAAHEEIRGRFLAEGRVQAQVRHAHIALVTDLVAEEGVAALVIEWLDGGSLDDRLTARNGARLDPEQALGVLLPVLDALTVLHGRGIVHRDLKPANLVFRDASWRSVVLTDFGIARIAEDAVTGGVGRQTRTGVRMGTPHYMSPEQVLGKPVDARSDLFALGVVAWELLTAVLPFDGASDFEIMQRIVDEQRPGLAKVRPDLPAPLIAAVDRAMAQDPARRFPSAREFAEALTSAAAPPLPRPAPPIKPAPPTFTPPPPTVTLPPPEEEEPDLDLEPDPTATEAPPARSGCGCCAMWSLTLFVLLSLAIGGAVVLLAWWASEQQAASRQQTQAIWEQLRVYKTDPAANRERDRLDQLATAAAAAVDTWETPEALGTVALIDAWRQGWQFASPSWDAAAWARVRDQIDRAAQEGQAVQTEVARVWLQLAACRLHPDQAVRDAACMSLGAEADYAVLHLDRDPWMAVEVDWAASLGARTQAERLISANRPLPVEFSTPALQRCGRGLARLDAAPVNGRYLEQNCVLLAGWSGDMAHYLRLADRMIVRARATGRLDADQRQTLFLGAGAPCASAGFKFDRNGSPTSWSGRNTGDWGDLCVYLAGIAEGCEVHAMIGRPVKCAPRLSFLLGSCVEARVPGVPWEAADVARDATDAERGAKCER